MQCSDIHTDSTVTSPPPSAVLAAHNRHDGFHHQSAHSRSGRYEKFATSDSHSWQLQQLQQLHGGGLMGR